MATVVATGPQQLALIERTDIHKSCRALETVVNLFNDYCQASEALALIQKKLSKALKEAAGTKATSQLAGDAFNASAFLLESLSDVDALFVKAADKECEMASANLKKWFKKLAKEEKEHDKKVAAANAKIKQAGEVFEKKAKKKDLAAAEAHSQYVQLLGAVGPQIVEEKQNHTITVTQHHTSATYMTALCVSRAADAEWARACGSVSKVAPLIGRVGELRAYLEGGWVTDIPFFRSEDGHTQRDERSLGPVSERVDEMGVRIAQSSSGTDSDASAHYSSAPGLGTPTRGTYSATTPRLTPSPSIPLTPPTSAGTSLPARTKPSGVNGPPPSSYFPHTLEKLQTDSVRSIESLSSFPAPPTHFPLPGLTPFPSSPLSQKSDDERTESVRTKPSPGNSALLPPASIDTDRTLTSSPLSMDKEQEDREQKGNKGTSETLGAPEPTLALAGHQRRHSAQLGVSSFETQLQERKSSGSGELGRSDSILSTSSIVASMRDKFARTESKDTSQQLPRERDTPRVVTNKVADLASRYVSPENVGNGLVALKSNSPTSDRARQMSGMRADGSSPGTSPLPTPRQSLGHSPSSSLAQVPSSTSISSVNLTPSEIQAPGQTSSEIDIVRRRKRLEELEDLDRREQAMALRAREREIDMRSKALEKERERIHAQSNVAESQSSHSVAGPASAIRRHNQHSYSMTNIALPRNSTDGARPRPVTQYGDPAALAMSGSQSTSSSDSRPSDHAPYCSCQQCSPAQYNGSRPSAGTVANGQFSHIQVVPTPRSQKDKVKGGWMRRLSMPAVSSAFSSDSKKSGAAYGVGSGIGGGPGVSPGLVSGTGYSTTTGMHAFTSDATGGISNVLVRPRKLSLGRR